MAYEKLMMNFLLSALYLTFKLFDEQLNVYQQFKTIKKCQMIGNSKSIISTFLSCVENSNHNIII